MQRWRRRRRARGILGVLQTLMPPMTSGMTTESDVQPVRQRIVSPERRVPLLKSRFEESKHLPSRGVVRRPKVGVIPPPLPLLRKGEGPKCYEEEDEDSHRCWEDSSRATCCCPRVFCKGMEIGMGIGNGSSTLVVCTNNAKRLRSPPQRLLRTMMTR